MGKFYELFAETLNKKVRIEFRNIQKNKKIKNTALQCLA
jgi:hypothetical protein